MHLEPISYGSETYHQFVRNPKTDTHFDVGTDPKVAEVLERLIASGDRVRLFYGDPVTGENWFSEYDVLGRVSRSNGKAKCPILLHNSRSTGGGAIRTKHIVAIVTNKGRWLYRHEGFKLPNDLHVTSDTLEPGYPFVVYNGDAPLARFTTNTKATRWLEFMVGLRFAKSRLLAHPKERVTAPRVQMGVWS